MIIEKSYDNKLATLALIFCVVALLFSSISSTLMVVFNASVAAFLFASNYEAAKSNSIIDLINNEQFLINQPEMRFVQVEDDEKNANADKKDEKNKIYVIYRK